MTKKEAFKIKACRCSNSKRYLLKALQIFYKLKDIEHNEEYGYYKVSLSILLGQSDYFLNCFNNLIREFTCCDELDNGFVKLFYKYD